MGGSDGPVAAYFSSSFTAKAQWGYIRTKNEKTVYDHVLNGIRLDYKGHLRTLVSRLESGRDARSKV